MFIVRSLLNKSILSPFGNEKDIAEAYGYFSDYYLKHKTCHDILLRKTS